MKARLLVTCLLVVGVGATGVGATHNASTETVSSSNRMLRRAGVYLGLIGDPFPTIVGVNLAYNAFDFARFTAGIGKISASIGATEASATTLGATSKFFVPGWNLSPVAGLGFSYVSVSQTGGSKITVSNFNDSAAHVYATIGVDWQAASGFNIGAGYNVSFKSGVGGLPYLNLGWYFDFI